MLLEMNLNSLKGVISLNKTTLKRDGPKMSAGANILLRDSPFFDIV